MGSHDYNNLPGRDYRGKSQGSEKFSELETPVQVLPLLSSNGVGGGAGTQASLALQSLPGATEKQMLF